MWQCRKSVPPKSFTFTLRDRGGVSYLRGFASSARFAVVRVRGLPCDVERLTLGELVLPVSDDWCFAEFHVTSKHCTSGSSAFSKVVLKTSDGCSSTCSGVGQNPQHAPVYMSIFIRIEKPITMLHVNAPSDHYCPANGTRSPSPWPVMNAGHRGTA